MNAQSQSIAKSGKSSGPFAIAPVRWAAVLLLTGFDAAVGRALPAVSAEPDMPKPPGLVLTVNHGDEVWCVAASADGSTLATGGKDKTARLWNAADGAERGPPLVDEGTIRGLKLSPDARYLITRHTGSTAVVFVGSRPPRFHGFYGQKGGHFTACGICRRSRAANHS